MRRWICESQDFLFISSCLSHIVQIFLSGYLEHSVELWFCMSARKRKPFCCIKVIFTDYGLNLRPVSAKVCPHGYERVHQVMTIYWMFFFFFGSAVTARLRIRYGPIDNTHLVWRVVCVPGLGFTWGYAIRWTCTAGPGAWYWIDWICRENSAFFAACGIEEAATGPDECEIIRRGLEFDYETRCQSNTEWELALAFTGFHLWIVFRQYLTLSLESWSSVQAQTLRSLIR